ncbi:MAG: N-acetylmuramate alpha-1-phosphate uridylyltransferase MurU [Burkholderiaceae bacterium]
MKAMILAAGRGERMRPLTDTCPKPLLPVHGKPLIVWHLEALARAGVREIVINTAWLEDRIVEALGDGARWGVSIAYSMEGRDHGGALETAGGIAQALPLLSAGDADADLPFWLVSADIHVPRFDFDSTAAARFGRGAALAHLWLVANPPYHPAGDFGLDADGFGLADGPGPDGQRWTYANLALLRPSLLREVVPGTRVALAPLLYAGMRERRISAEVWSGDWHNLGTPDQLAALSQAVAL